ncbi:MAG: TetR/AcrR family transcriptional regulator [Lachnospiraceae bacterium]|nr:TetR/AcrR family transcriptional regulator [Lachnospiraceae bacterium]
MNVSSNPSALRSQKEITDALLLLMQKYPYDQISVKQILLEARIARMTFYRNYDSKEDVLISLIKSILREYFDTVNTGKVDLLTTVFTFAYKNRSLILMLEKNNMLHILLQCINEYLPVLHNSFFTKDNPFNILMEGLNADYIMALNIGALYNVISLWVHKDMTDTPETVRSNIDQYIKRIGLLQQSTYFKEIKL